jgi:hypothetical protein
LISLSIGRALGLEMTEELLTQDMPLLFYHRGYRFDEHAALGVGQMDDLVLAEPQLGQQVIVLRSSELPLRRGGLSRCCLNGLPHLLRPGGITCLVA